MKKLGFAFFFIFLSQPWVRMAAAPMTKFEIRHCDAQNSCFVASGEKANISLSQNYLSASEIQVKVTRKGQVPQINHCASMTYDLITQLLICDNQDVGRPSLTINSQMVVRKFN